MAQLSEFNQVWPLIYSWRPGISPSDNKQDLWLLSKDNKSKINRTKGNP